MQSHDQVLADASAVSDSLPVDVLGPQPLVEAPAAEPVAEIHEPEPVLEFHNPQPLANPLVTEAQVDSHRALVCTAYDRCLDFAVRKGWRGWTCRICPQFEIERNAQLERLRELTDALPSSRAA